MDFWGEVQAFGPHTSMQYIVRKILKREGMIRVTPTPGQIRRAEMLDAAKRIRAEAFPLREKGMTFKNIGKHLGVKPSRVRALLRTPVSHSVSSAPSGG